MRVIRRKDDILKILCFGHVEPGSFGVFDTDIYEEVDIDQLPEGWSQDKLAPIARGKDLVQYIESAFQGQPLLLRGTLLNLFVNFPLSTDLATATGSPYLNIKDVLLSITCNPLTQSDLNEIISIIESGQVPTSTRDQFVGLANTWKVGKRLD